jgi:hypothetical protein
MRMRDILVSETTYLFETKIVHDWNNHLSNSDWLALLFSYKLVLIELLSV